MTEVVSVRFKNKGKVYFFDPAGIKVASGADVIVETSKGLEFANCTWGNHWVEDSALVLPLRPIIRIATEDDVKRCEENKRKEAEAFNICQEKIIKHEIDMKLVDVEYNFEGTKILFFFTSDGRVDFRELVKDLASVFRTRIELRQIGVRDEARMLGGLGICGKPFCCSQFLDEFHPVSIKMAKTQGLSLNPTKISGTCGRLMCCLKYEQFAYEDLVKKAPKVDAFVDTPGGKGSVTSVNLLRSYAKVKLEDTQDTTLKTYSFDELEILGGKARRAEYLAAKAEGKLEEAGFSPSNIRQSKIEAQPKNEDDEAPFVFADGTVAKSSQSDETPAPKPTQKSHNAKSKNKKKSKPAQKPENVKTHQNPAPAKKQENSAQTSAAAKPASKNSKPKSHTSPQKSASKPSVPAQPNAEGNHNNQHKKSSSQNKHYRYYKKRSPKKSDGKPSPKQ